MKNRPLRETLPDRAAAKALFHAEQERAAKLRESILALLDKNPGMTNAQLRAELDMHDPVAANRLCQALSYLLRHSHITADKTHGKQFKYGIFEGERVILHVPADKLPKLPGCVYSPMGWIVHQLETP